MPNSSVNGPRYLPSEGGVAGQFVINTASIYKASSNKIVENW